MRLLLDNVNSKHIEWLKEMSKALNFTITEIDLTKDEPTHVEEPETTYLLSTKANQEHLQKSLQQAKEGKTSSVDIDDLWK